MGYIKNYISKEEFFLQYNGASWKFYTGFVIGYGYAYPKFGVVQPPHLCGYSPQHGRLYDDVSHCTMSVQMVVDRSLKAVKQSLHGLFVNGEAVFSIQQGMTLSGIASWFDVTVQNLVDWNNISNPDLIYIGQRIKILSSGGGSRRTTTTTTQKAPKVTPKGVTPTQKLETKFTSETPPKSPIVYSSSISIVNEIDLFVGKISSFTKTNIPNPNADPNARVKYSSDIATVNGYKNTTSSVAYSTSFHKVSLGASTELASSPNASLSLSFDGRLDIEGTVKTNDLWDRTYGMKISVNSGKDNNISTGFGVEYKPVKMLAAVGAVVVVVYAAPVIAAAATAVGVGKLVAAGATAVFLFVFPETIINENEY